MDRYATHLEALVTHALASAPRPILELGCGDYSTPVLAAIAKAQGRRLLVQAQDGSWAQRYRDLCEVQMVNWADWTPPAGHWGMVLLDSEESTADRIRHLEKLRGCADVVILHDADAAMTRPHWKESIQGFTVELYQRYEPWTAVLRPCSP